MGKAELPARRPLWRHGADRSLMRSGALHVVGDTGKELLGIRFLISWFRGAVWNVTQVYQRPGQQE
jgi:hypothetical protein